MHNTREDIIRLVEENDVEFIRLQFTDIFGTTKNMAVTTSQLEKVLDNKETFDGSVIEGFVGYEKMELKLVPDLDTFTIFPWRPQSGKVARLICDVTNYDGTPYGVASRNILRTVMKKAEDMGLFFDVSPECEFFLFDRTENDEPTTYTRERGNYFDIGPTDEGENARRDIVMSLEDMGFEIKSSYHEASPAQHEIDFKEDQALRTADNVMTFRMAVRTIAKRHGLHATFMPKPREDLCGSAMSINLTAYNEVGKNMFVNSDDKNGLSDMAYHFIAGVLTHVNGLCAICNPIINSYKRLIDGKYNPAFIGWSTINANAVVRIPVHAQKGSIIFKSPDSAANPYLALAVIIAAGLDGIKNNLEPGNELDKTYEQIVEEKIYVDRIPKRLEDSLDAFEQDSVLVEALGDELTSVFVKAKRKECKEYSEQVSKWEIERYLYRI